MERYIQFSFFGAGTLFRAGDLSVEENDARLVVSMKGVVLFNVPAERGEYGIEWTDEELRLYKNDRFLEAAPLEATCEYRAPEILGGVKQLIVGRGRFPYS